MAGEGVSLFTVTVENDVPKAVDDYNVNAQNPFDQPLYTVLEGGSGDLSSLDFANTDDAVKTSGNVLNNDLPGADEDIKLISFTYTNENGTSADGIIDQWMNTQYGAFKISAVGDFEYMSDAYSSHRQADIDYFIEDIEYTVEDADGDISSALLKIRIDDTVATAGDPEDEIVYEKYLPNGSARDEGTYSTDPESDTSLTQPGALNITKGQDPIDTVFDLANPVVVTDMPPAIDVKDGRNVNVTSNGQQVYYDVSDDGHTIDGITADGTVVFTVTITDPSGSNGSPGYEFELFKPLDHVSTDADGQDDDKIDLLFPFAVTELDDNDAPTGSFIVTVVDDASPETVEYELPEDGSINIPTNADVEPDDLTAGTFTVTDPPHGTVTVEDDGSLTYEPDGDYSGEDTFTYTITEEDGEVITTTVTMTVTPVSDAPSIPIVEDVPVITPEDQPVALGLMAPIVKDATDKNGLEDGDYPERLGLITLTGIPANAELLDGSQGNAVVLPQGQEVHEGSSITIYLSDLDENGDSTNDHLSSLVPGDADLVLTTEQFEALQVLPPPDSNENFTVTLSVEEYEVDADGNMLWDGADAASPVAPKDSTATIDVVVKAVTDHVDLRWQSDAPDTEEGDSFDALTVGDLAERTDIDPDYDYIYDSVQDGAMTKWIDEDSTFNLKDLLEYDATDPADALNSLLGNPEEREDGSEVRSIVLNNLPDGTVVNGTAIGSDGTITVQLVDNKTLPDINIRPPADFSGTIEGIQISLRTEDTDSSDTDVQTVDDTDLIEQEHDYVLLNLMVRPQAGDVAVDDVTGAQEDVKLIRFLENLRVTDTDNAVDLDQDPPSVNDNGGYEEITAITINDIPEGWTLVAPDGVTVLSVTDGSYTIPALDVLDGSYRDYTLTPPEHSSADAFLKLVVTSKDVNSETGASGHEVTTDGEGENPDPLDLRIWVSPKGEVLGDENEPTNTDEWILDGSTERSGDSDNDGTPDDLHINPDHQYTDSLVEDEWFELNQGFDLTEGWFKADGTTPFNEDPDEYIYALFTPLVVNEQNEAGDLVGSRFRYVVDDTDPDNIEYKTFVYTGDPVEIPIAGLATLEYMPPPEYSTPDGSTVRILVNAMTVDPDPDGGLPDMQVSGEAVLTFAEGVAPVADIVTLEANTPGGFEDMKIPLNISLSSSDTDGSETFTATIKDIPEGAEVYYDGDEDDDLRVLVQMTDPDTGDPILDPQTGEPLYQVTIEDFDNSAYVGIMPPQDCNVDFVLTIEGYSVEQDGSSTAASPGVLPLKVPVRGVADLSDDMVQTVQYTEAAVDGSQSHLIPLLDTDPEDTIPDGPLVRSTTSDSDGSESLTMNITGLPEGFSLSGEGVVSLGGSGESREWIVAEADLGNVNVVVPEHFSGTLQFQGTAVTTDNDGHTLAAGDAFGDDPVERTFTIEITPSPESTINAGSIADEDVLTPLDFSLIGEDPSEEITALWIKVDDVDNVGDFVLYLGNSTETPLSSASSVSIETIGSESYYKLSGTDISNVYVLGAADKHGAYPIGLRFEVTDSTDDGSLDPEVQTYPGDSEDSFSYLLTLNAVTDTISESIGTITVSNEYADVDQDEDVVNVAGATTIIIPLTVSQQDRPEGPDAVLNTVDDDGSETLLRFEIIGVPEGVSVEGAVYQGDVYNSVTMQFVNSGRWVLEENTAFDSASLGKEVTLNVDGTWGQLQGLEGGVDVTIFAISADNGSFTTSADQSVTLVFPASDTGNFSDGVPVDPPPAVSNWILNPSFNPVEDTPSSLNQFIDDSSLQLDVSGNFTVTLSGLPAEATVEGTGPYAGKVSSFQQNGETVWTISGSGGTAALKELLAHVTITPPEDDNSNNSDPLDFDIALTTYSGSTQNNAVVSVVQEVIPDSDEPSVSFEVTGADEQTGDTLITVSLENDHDDPSTILVDNTLYIALNETAMLRSGGSLGLVSGGTAISSAPVSVVDEGDIPDGEYYVVSGVVYGTDVALSYTSFDDDAAGTIAVTGYIQTSEENDPENDEVAGSGSVFFPVTPFVDGYDFDVRDSFGDESDGVDVVHDLIRLDIEDNGLIDEDGSESVVSVVLTGVPNGMLVYAGDDVEDAYTAGKALNTGDDGSGSGTNRWVLLLDDDGTLPGYIGALPSEDVSGTFDLMLALQVQESDGTLGEQQFDSFTLTINPVAYPIDEGFFNPTDTFGTESDRIFLNLNASLEDTVDYYSPGDNGQDDLETVTLTFSGLGDHAAFYDGNGDFIESVEYNAGAYTISGVTVDHVNDLTFTQSAFSGIVDVSIFTSDGNSESSPVVADFNVDIYEVLSTSGDDQLVFDAISGRSYDGLEGDDTLLLRDGYELDEGIRQGESIDFDSDPDLQNIEVIDMTNHSANSLESISVQDVLDMTDSRNVLEILGDDKDSVSLTGSWEDLGVQDGFHGYTSGGVTLNIEETIAVL
ncbi:hypothetical protein CR161_08035 [Prosthecochloris sp. ZM]|nr:hypothetical protein CR161_08035 [Prosthecochloris sp. ZM]